MLADMGIHPLSPHGATVAFELPQGVRLAVDYLPQALHQLSPKQVLS